MPDPAADPRPLTARDWLLLAGFSLALFAISPLFGRMLSGHESVQPQTSREMFHGGDWLVPSIGGDPWLERPPAPMWLICGVYALAGTAAHDGVARCAALLVAVPLVLLVAGIGSRLAGRTTGLAAGFIFATGHEVYSYASNPEADIFLALIVTAVLAVFVRLEFPAPGAAPAAPQPDPGGFLTGRPWRVAVFFALLGATNLAKGVIFGTAMALLPILSYLAWNRSWRQIRRYLWLWGWLIAAAVALAWPVVVISRHPDILQLWKEHYLGRLNHGYLAEPWWYYAAYVPYVLLPWTLAALVGLGATGKAAFAGPGPERFLWCWALVPPAVFSLSDGKHHHYLLQCLAPWAILSVHGAALLWRFCRERFPRWLQEPLLAAAVVGVAGTVALIVLGERVPGGRPVVLVIGAFLPIAAFVVAWSLLQPNPRTAFVGVLLTITTAYALWTPYQAAYLDQYPPDAELVQQACQLVPTDQPVFVQYDWTAPLETFWVLYHCPRPGVLIRDPWQLAERSPGQPAAYILARRHDAPMLAQVGTVQPLLESRLTRGEKHPDQRRVLFKVTFHPHIPPPPPEYIQVTRRTLW
jgi:4-amino-4-deoxy-L-arabinose transferase-like glycosyltransferase